MLSTHRLWTARDQPKRPNRHKCFLVFGAHHQQDTCVRSVLSFSLLDCIKAEHITMRVSLLACWALFASLSLAGVLAQDDAAEDASTAEKPKPPVEEEVDDFDPNNRDWGSYYDPQGVFCGKYDCYKILGFDYESFGKLHPDRKKITKRYRKLSRAWHPDKSNTVMPRNDSSEFQGLTKS